MTPAQIADAQELARKWNSRPETQHAAVSPPLRPQKPACNADYAFSGSGLFVSENGDVVTNAHVVEGCTTAEVTFQARPYNSACHRQRLEDRSGTLEGAPAVPLPAARLRLTVRQGENIFAYGFPLTGLLSSGGTSPPGTVTALSGLNDDSRILQMSAPVSRETAAAHCSMKSGMLLASLWQNLMP